MVNSKPRVPYQFHPSKRRSNWASWSTIAAIRLHCIVIKLFDIKDAPNRILDQISLLLKHSFKHLCWNLILELSFILSWREYKAIILVFSYKMKKIFYILTQHKFVELKIFVDNKEMSSEVNTLPTDSWIRILDHPLILNLTL